MKLVFRRGIQSQRFFKTAMRFVILGFHQQLLAFLPQPCYAFTLYYIHHRANIHEVAERASKKAGAMRFPPL
jgi:hypothetical protein